MTFKIQLNIPGETLRALFVSTSRDIFHGYFQNRYLLVNVACELPVWVQPVAATAMDGDRYGFYLLKNGPILCAPQLSDCGGQWSCSRRKAGKAPLAAEWLSANH